VGCKVGNVVEIVGTSVASFTLTMWDVKVKFKDHAMDAMRVLP